MKRIIPLLIFVSCIYNTNVAFSQSLVVDITGSVVNETNYVNVEGTPYFNENWVKGVVKLKSGKVYEDLDVRLDLVKDELLFKNKDGKVLAFVEPVLEFTLIPNIQNFINGIKGLSNYTEKNYFQSLNEGKVKILKKNIKTIVERKEYNSATTTKSFVENSLVFILTPAQTAVPLKRDKKFILSVLNDQVAPLETYITEKKLNLKKDSDLISLIDYYNSLSLK